VHVHRRRAAGLRSVPAESATAGDASFGGCHMSAVQIVNAWVYSCVSTLYGAPHAPLQLPVSAAPYTRLSHDDDQPGRVELSATATNSSTAYLQRNEHCFSMASWVAQKRSVLQSPTFPYHVPVSTLPVGTVAPSQTLQSTTPSRRLAHRNDMGARLLRVVLRRNRRRIADSSELVRSGANTRLFTLTVQV